MSKRSLTSIFAVAFTVAPLTTFAAGKDLQYVINTIIFYLNQILWLLIGLAVVIFVYYVIQYFIKPNEDRKNAGTYVMYSLIGFFVVLSFWGLVNILQNTFGLQNESNQPQGWSSFKGLFPNSSGPSSGAAPGSPTSNPGNFGGQTGQPGNFGGTTPGDSYGQEPNPTTGANMGN